MICPHCHAVLHSARSSLDGVAICSTCQRAVRIAAQDVFAAPAISNAPATRWYLRGDDGASAGPLSKEQLDELAQACELNSATQIWQEGWQQAIWAAQLYPWVADIVPILPDADDSSGSGQGVLQDCWVETESCGPAKSPRAWALAAFIAVTAVGAFFMLGLTLALRCPAKPTLTAVFSFVGGMIAIGGAIFDWNWFWSHRKSKRLRSLLGPTAARLFYAGIGGLLIVCALGVALQYSQAGARAPAPRKSMRRSPAWQNRIPIEIGRQ